MRPRALRLAVVVLLAALAASAWLLLLRRSEGVLFERMAKLWRRHVDGADERGDDTSVLQNAAKNDRRQVVVLDASDNVLARYPLGPRWFRLEADRPYEPGILLQIASGESAQVALPKAATAKPGKDPWTQISLVGPIVVRLQQDVLRKLAEPKVRPGKLFHWPTEASDPRISQVASDLDAGGGSSDGDEGEIAFVAPADASLYYIRDGAAKVLVAWTNPWQSEHVVMFGETGQILSPLASTAASNFTISVSEEGTFDVEIRSADRKRRSKRQTIYVSQADDDLLAAAWRAARSQRVVGGKVVVEGWPIELRYPANSSVFMAKSQNLAVDFTWSYRGADKGGSYVLRIIQEPANGAATSGASSKPEAGTVREYTRAVQSARLTLVPGRYRWNVRRVPAGSTKADERMSSPVRIFAIRQWQTFSQVLQLVPTQVDAAVYVSDR